MRRFTYKDLKSFNLYYAFYGFSFFVFILGLSMVIDIVDHHTMKKEDAVYFWIFLAFALFARWRIRNEILNKDDSET